MTRTHKIVLAGTVALIIVAAVAVKWIFFPSIKDAYFTMNQQSLGQAPSGLVVVRPTHFPKSIRKGIMSDTIQVSGQRVWRMMGRNVTFQQLVAAAYGRSEARVVLPATAPKTNFDFLVTVRGNQQQQLQKAIRKKLGFIAQTETSDEEVLTLKIANGTLPGLTASDASAKPNVHFDKGKLYFTHMRPSALTEGLEQMLKLPVVDKTDLTNFYDFSAVWDSQMQRQIQNEATATAAIKKILNGWGLALEPDSDRVEVLVVKSAT
jgi:uncharacterized protein (TIGR03435 family)